MFPSSIPGKHIGSNINLEPDILINLGTVCIILWTIWINCQPDRWMWRGTGASCIMIFCEISQIVHTSITMFSRLPWPQATILQIPNFLALLLSLHCSGASQLGHYSAAHLGVWGVLGHTCVVKWGEVFGGNIFFYTKGSDGFLFKWKFWPTQSLD